MASAAAPAQHPAANDPRKAGIRAAIRTIPDFPKPGAPARSAPQPPHAHHPIYTHTHVLTRLHTHAPTHAYAGIMFQDITTLLLNPAAYKDCIDLLVERYRGAGLDVIAGFEARGFFFGPQIALALGLPFVPLRKPKKLPGTPRIHTRCNTTRLRVCVLSAATPATQTRV
jgi:hypothetical protein